MALIKQQSIQNLLEYTDILDVISSYLQVRRSGASYVCVCPFHGDTNPSLHININRQFFHCFACGAGGDAIKFVQDYEKISFKEAVEKIADISGFTLEYEEGEQKGKNLSLEVLNQAYKNELKNHQNAIIYLKNRGLSEQDFIDFNIGYAPMNNFTLRVLQNSKISQKDALEYGVLKKNQNGIYASFINRITFGINNDKGRIVGFGGRTLSDEEKIAKYVNSPESIVFKKSRLLYLYDKAKQDIYKSAQIIICEGYMDAIALHKAGIKNAVAVLGVALTPFHLPLIKKPNARVILCFDSDKAGKTASFKSAKLLSQNGISGEIARLKGGKDPSEILNTFGAEELKKQLFTNGIDLGEFCINEILNQNDLSDPISMQNAIKQAKEYTKTLGEFAAAKYDEYIAKKFGVNTQKVFNTKTIEIYGNHTKFQKNMQKNNSKDYSELGLILFLHENPAFINIFKMTCSVEFFTHKDILLEVCEQNGIEKSKIRELLMDKNIGKIVGYWQFLQQICLINLRFFSKNFNCFTNTLEKGLKTNIFRVLSTKITPLINENSIKELIVLINEVLKTTDTKRLNQINFNIEKKDYK